MGERKKKETLSYLLSYFFMRKTAIVQLKGLESEGHKKEANS